MLSIPDGLKKKDSFLKMVRKAVKGGLSKESALRALTYEPARMVQMTGQVGSLQDGRIASFFITDKDLFADDARARHIGGFQPRDGLQLLQARWLDLRRGPPGANGRIQRA